MLRHHAYGFAVAAVATIGTLIPQRSVAQVIVPAGPVSYPPQYLAPVAPEYSRVLQNYPMYSGYPMYTGIPEQPPTMGYPEYAPPLTGPQIGPTRPSVEMGQLAPGQTLTSPSFRTRQNVFTPPANNNPSFRSGGTIPRVLDNHTFTPLPFPSRPR